MLNGNRAYGELVKAHAAMEHRVHVMTGQQRFLPSQGVPEDAGTRPSTVPERCLPPILGLDVRPGPDVADPPAECGHAYRDADAKDVGQHAQNPSPSHPRGLQEQGRSDARSADQSYSWWTRRPSRAAEVFRRDYLPCTGSLRLRRKIADGGLWVERRRRCHAAAHAR